MFATQVAVAGEFDSSGVAGQFGAASTAALLRHTLAISGSDASSRVNTARAVLPRDGISGGELPPVLPLLGDALAEGGIGVEQTRIVVASMRKIPKDVDPVTRDSCEQLLVDKGREFEPAPFANFAKAVVATVSADAAPDDEDRANRIEFHLGVRDPYTGMTKFRGQVDDLGAEVLSQAIDGLSQPCPERQNRTVRAGRHRPRVGNGRHRPRVGHVGRAGADRDRTRPRTGTEPVRRAADRARPGAGQLIPDSRSAACRRGQALLEALRRFLDLGLGPIQGGERPHVTVTVDLEVLRSKIGAAYLDFGGTIDAGTARMLACDASIVPAVLGSPSQVLDVGMASRLFTDRDQAGDHAAGPGMQLPGL